MRPIVQAAAAVALSIVTVLCCAAIQDDSAQKTRMERATVQAGAEYAAPAPPTAAMADDPGSAVLADPATRRMYLSAMQHYYEYRANGYAYRSRVFEWQLLSSRLIFVAVVLLVIAGVYFAAVQFHVALAISRRAGTYTAKQEDAASSVDDTLKTELEVSAKGVVVRSSMLGVIVLALSLAFFYLYLVYVYPIRDVI
ncbi:hypothetical protein [Burkholderia sp. Ac-20365]|uniref:hypothetical protein n=1 Tax=Burkholderia sp. Ac-20365 TaxID=2703897 RepID=UPI00197BD2BA|nr:hypothetical protein [Burkholderia sp. Ac-20365]MBN3760745.1 hypothetical protein [Burkholderia sp. Ac-20365]